MNISAVKYNSEKKPMQPNNVGLDNLYWNATYAGVVFDYVLYAFENKFKKQTGANCNVKFGPLKEAKRVYEKLKGDVDIQTPSDILDILRATVTFNTIEDLLEFVNFTKNLNFTYEDFTPDALDKKALLNVRSRIKKNVVEVRKNLGIIDIYDRFESVLKESEGKDENRKKEIKEKRNFEIEGFSQNFSLPDEQVRLETSVMFNHFHRFLADEKNLPIANIGISNGFSLGVDESVKEKYPFLKGNLKERDSNYMDLKFYVCIPIPFGEKNYMVCEVIATLDCFNKVYDKTHSLFELERTKFEARDDDDVTKDDYMLALNLIKRSMYLDDVIDKYNNEHPDSIQIVPYENDRNYISNTLNKLGDSTTITVGLCHCRDLMR